jgi:cyclase
MKKIAIALLLATAAWADSSATRERTVTKLAENVYTIRHDDPLPTWVNGNTTVIIGSRGVFVVDSCNVGWAAREDIADIKKWTSKPVLYLLNTHWHHDHSAGNNDYVAAWPGVQIIAHAETQRMFEASVPHVRDDIFKSIPETEKMLKTLLEDKSLAEDRRKYFENRLTRVPAVFEDTKAFVHQPPTLLFEQDFTVDLGDRKVEVKHLGRGNTGGDAVAYLPAEKILAAGDLVVSPVPFTFDGYPSEWARTLDKIIDLQPAIIVPGHGEVMRDTKFVTLLRDLFTSVVRQVDAAIRKNAEATPEDVSKLVDVAALRDAILGSNTKERGFFDYALLSLIKLSWYEAKLR